MRAIEDLFRLIAERSDELCSSLRGVQKVAKDPLSSSPVFVRQRQRSHPAGCRSSHGLDGTDYGFMWRAAQVGE